MEQRLKLQQQQALMQQALLQQQQMYHPGMLAATMSQVYSSYPYYQYACSLFCEFFGLFGSLHSRVRLMPRHKNFNKELPNYCCLDGMPSIFETYVMNVKFVCLMSWTLLQEAKRKKKCSRVIWPNINFSSYSLMYLFERLYGLFNYYLNILCYFIYEFKKNNLENIKPGIISLINVIIAFSWTFQVEWGYC